MRDEQAAEKDWYVLVPEVLVPRRSGGEWKVLPSAVGFGTGAVSMTVVDCEPTISPEGSS